MLYGRIAQFVGNILDIFAAIGQKFFGPHQFIIT